MLRLSACLASLRRGNASSGCQLTSWFHDLRKSHSLTAPSLAPADANTYSSMKTTLVTLGEH